MEDKIIIKKMESDEEILGKAYVHFKAWQETYPGIVDPDFLSEQTLEKCEEIAYKYLDNILVAKDNDKVVGFVSYGKYRNSDLEDTGEVPAIYLLSEYQGRGIGKRMMEEALKHLEEYKQVALWVLKENRKAIGFYESCGFHPDGHEETIIFGSPIIEARMIRETENKKDQLWNIRK